MNKCEQAHISVGWKRINFSEKSQWKCEWFVKRKHRYERLTNPYLPSSYPTRKSLTLFIHYIIIDVCIDTFKSIPWSTICLCSQCMVPIITNLYEQHTAILCYLKSLWHWIRDLFHSRNYAYAGINSCMRSTNKRRRNNVTLSLIGWVHTQNYPCIRVALSCRLLWFDSGRYCRHSSRSLHCHEDAYNQRNTEGCGESIYWNAVRAIAITNTNTQQYSVRFYDTYCI